MSRYVARRAFHGLLLIVVIMLTTFFVFHMLGDPVRRILPINATEEQVETYRVANGFADPLPEQAGRFVRSVATLDFGDSYTNQRPALPVVTDALPRTMVLAGAALVISLVAGVGIGVSAAVNRGGLVDRALTALSVSLVSLAEFWVGLMLIAAFAVSLDALPTGGYGLDDRLVLPALTLAIAPMGRIAFIVRNTTADTLDEAHVLYATAMGIPRQTVFRKHVLKNAATPVIALVGLEATSMLVGGAVVVETVFAWPGIGRLYATAMLRYDLPLVTATLFLATLIVLTLNLFLDLIYARLDPRIRYR